MSQIPQIFDRKLLRLKRERSLKKLPESDFLYNEVAERLSTQFAEGEEGLITAKFDSVLQLGFKNPSLCNMLKAKGQGTKNYVITELSPHAILPSGEYSSVIADEEFLAFQDASFDLVISNLNLHTVNDLPGTLFQINRILKKNGFFIATLFGPETVTELKNSLQKAELQLSSQFSPRVFPFVDVASGASLLQRTKFAEPVSSNEIIKVKYTSLFDLLSDLKNMGETNILNQTNKSVPSKDLFKVADEIFTSKYPSEDGASAISTFEIVYLSGWKL